VALHQTAVSQGGRNLLVPYDLFYVSRTTSAISSGRRALVFYACVSVLQACASPWACMLTRIKIHAHRSFAAMKFQPLDQDNDDDDAPVVRKE
jgi:hypothetical protein